jgi:hypothetical protein
MPVFRYRLATGLEDLSRDRAKHFGAIVEPGVQSEPNEQQVFTRVARSGGRLGCPRPGVGWLRHD